MSGYKEQLPPPKSGLQAEISFRRFLQRCEELAAGDNKGRPDLEDWARSPVFHANIETLQEQAADLESLPNSRIEPQVLRAYRDQVDALASKILPAKLPAYLTKLPPRDKGSVLHPASAPSTSGAPGHVTAGNAIGCSPAITAPEAVHADLRQRAGKGLSGPLHKSTQERIDRHKNLQESLTDEMAALAEGLKKNAKAMQQSVNKRGSLLEDTDSAIEDGLARAKKSSKESKALKIRGSITFCMILMAILAVSLAFVGTYMFIKTTSFVGYRARPRP